MDEARLRRLNLAIAGSIATVLGLVGFATPWGSVGLGAWTALPVLVFVPLVLLARARVGQQVVLAALVVFGALALPVAGSGKVSMDPFSPIVAWMLPVALLVLAVVVAGCAALVAARLAARTADP